MRFPLRNSFLAGFLIYGLLSAEQTPAQLVVQIGQNFTGSTYGVNSQSLPPDANGAIGPRHFMEFINGAVAVYNKTNGLAVQRKSNLAFWSKAGVIISPDAVVTDPRVIYDPAVQRWFASQVDADAAAADPTLEANDFLFAVSATSDPTGSWHGFLFQADPDNGYFADFPTLGVDAGSVYIAGDFYQGQLNPVGPGLISIPKTDLMASAPTVDNRTWFGVMSYAERGQVLQPAICVDGSSAGNILAMGDIGMDSDPHSNLVSFVVQDGAGPGLATLTASTNIEVISYVVPFNSDQGVPMFNALQPDGTTTLTGNDARLSAKVYGVAGVLYAVHSTEVDNRMAIRWYRINATTHVLLESGTIADPVLDLFFPSIAANADGTMVIGCNGSGPTTYISCYAFVGATVNGFTAFEPRILLQAGSIDYHGDDELLAQLQDMPPLSRWGDYSATSVDPSDPSRFWTIQVYPADSDIWATQITELVVINPALSVAHSNATAVVSWPVAAKAFNLESKSNLSSADSWIPITAPFTTNNGRIYFQTPLTNNASFFRLRKP